MDDRYEVRKANWRSELKRYARQSIHNMERAIYDLENFERHRYRYFRDEIYDTEEIKDKLARLIKHVKDWIGDE